MKTETHEYTKIIANDGYFLTNNKGLYGIEIVLGETDLIENFVELPISEWPNEVFDDSDSEEIQQEQTQTPHELNLLNEEKFVKITQITSYDISNNVNGFYYNDKFMWLDRETRVSLKNTIESLESVGRDTLNIWYDDVFITIDTNSAKQLLSVLEVYASDCFNVTAQHKNAVMNMTNVEDVKNFDITADYPEMLHFNTNK